MELTVSNTLSRHYRTLELAFVWKYFEILLGKGQENQLILDLNFDLIKGQPSKSEKINRQRNCQSYNPIETLPSLTYRKVGYQWHNKLFMIDNIESK